MSLYAAIMDWRDRQERKRLGAEMADQFEADPSAYGTMPAATMDPYGGGTTPTGAEQVYGGLVQRGLSPHIAAGFAGNFQQESGFNPASLNEGEGAYGVGQWRMDRRDALHSAYGPNPTLDQQLDFVMQELGGSESDAWNQISQAQSPGEAAALIDRYYERSAGTERDVRMGYADNIYNQYSRQGPSFSPDGSIRRGPAPATGVQHPFSPPPQAVGNTGHMPDPRLPHNFQRMGVEFLRNGYFDEALQVLSPMQKYAIDSNMARSNYGLNSTLQQEAYLQRQDLMREEQRVLQARQLQQQQFDAQQQALRLEPETRRLDIAQGQLDLEREKFERPDTSMPSHMVTPFRELTEVQDNAINAIDTLDRAIDAVRTPVLKRTPEQKGQEAALIADIKRLAIQDARIANGGAEPNTEQIEAAMETYGYDPAQRRLLGNDVATQERLAGLRDRWVTALQDSERQMGDLGVDRYRSSGRTGTVQQYLQDRRTKAAAAAQQGGLTIEGGR